MQDLKIHNTLSGNKDLFKSINPESVTMYVCGPTVYGEPHLGHARPAITFDILFRYLKYLGYKVRYVRNITDVGHLLNDADEGADKIGEKAKALQIEPMEVAHFYTKKYHESMYKLNVDTPSIEPIASGHIIEQIEMIKKIIKNGFAYEVNGSVYFDVLKFNSKNKYGKLSKRNIEDLIHNTRSLDGQSDKKNPQDFALWKKADSQHIMRWPSPWGDGFPGWHLECTAMSTKYLGKRFDIHGGGMDLKFPHHECEIAQSEACHGNNPVNIWMHANMLTLNGQKMAKSTGNYILPNDFFKGKSDHLTKKYSASVVRFFILQAHYRSVLDFSNNALLASEKGYNKLMDCINTLPNLVTHKESSGFDLELWVKDCYKAMNDDFNSPILIAELFSVVKFINQVKDGLATISVNDLKSIIHHINIFVFDILGLKNDIEVGTEFEGKLKETVDLLINMRAEARLNKDFDLSDKIRDRLTEIGIQLKDEKDGTTFSIEKL